MSVSWLALCDFSLLYFFVAQWNILFVVWHFLVINTYIMASSSSSHATRGLKKAGEQCSLEKRKQLLASNIDRCVQQVINGFRKPRNDYALFTTQQRDSLREAYVKHGPKPSREVLGELARRMGLTLQQVIRWFYRERSSKPDYTPTRYFTKAQKAKLLQHLFRCPFPSGKMIHKLALEFGVTEQKISQWFKTNRNLEGIKSPSHPKPKVAKTVKFLTIF